MTERATIGWTQQGPYHPSWDGWGSALKAHSSEPCVASQTFWNRPQP